MIVMEKQRAIQLRRNAEMVGTLQEVHVEGFNPALHQWFGHTSCHRTLNFSAPDADEKDVIGTYLPVRVTRAGANSLVGERAFVV